MKINRGTIRGVKYGKTAKIVVKPNMTKEHKQHLAFFGGVLGLSIYGIVREIFTATVEGYEKAEFDNRRKARVMVSYYKYGPARKNFGEGRRR